MKHPNRLDGLKRCCYKDYRLVQVSDIVFRLCISLNFESQSFYAFESSINGLKILPLRRLQVLKVLVIVVSLAIRLKSGWLSKLWDLRCLFPIEKYLENRLSATRKRRRRRSFQFYLKLLFLFAPILNKDFCFDEKVRSVDVDLRVKKREKRRQFFDATPIFLRRRYCSTTSQSFGATIGSWLYYKTT